MKAHQHQEGAPRGASDLPRRSVLVAALIAAASPALAVLPRGGDPIFAAIAKWEPASQAHHRALSDGTNDESDATGDALYEIECDIAEMDPATPAGVLAKLDWFDAWARFYAYDEAYCRARGFHYQSRYESGHAVVELSCESLVRTLRAKLAAGAWS